MAEEKPDWAQELEQGLNENVNGFNVSVSFPDMEEIEEYENSQIQASSREVYPTDEDLDEYINQQDMNFEEYEDRKSLEEKYDVEIEDTDWESQNKFSADDGALANKTLEEAANIKQTSPNNISMAKECYEGFKFGCYEALRALQEIGAWGGAKVAEMITGEEIDFDPSKDTKGFGFNQGESPEPESTAGSIAKAVGQIATGYALGGGLMKMAGGALKSVPYMEKALTVCGKNKWGKRLISMTIDAAKGFVADTLSMSANDENFMEMLNEMGLPTVESIVKNEDDSFWTKKIKNGVDGILAGVIIGFIGGTAKRIWNMIPQGARIAGVVSVGAEYTSKKMEEKLKDEGMTNE